MVSVRTHPLVNSSLQRSLTSLSPALKSTKNNSNNKLGINYLTQNYIKHAKSSPIPKSILNAQ